MPPRVTAVAEQAAAAVHELAHLTRPAIISLHISDLATLTASLADLAAGLPQTLHQLSGYLPAEDHDTAVDHATASLRHAGAAAVHLAAALEAAHQSLGDLTETTQTEPEGVNIQPTKRGQNSTGVDSARVDAANYADDDQRGRQLTRDLGVPNNLGALTAVRRSGRSPPGKARLAIYKVFVRCGAVLTARIVVSGRRRRASYGQHPPAVPATGVPRSLP